MSPAERVEALDLERRVRLLTGADFWGLHAEPAIGLRRIVTSDGPAGVRGERWDERDPSANVPSGTALAATWDPDRIERIGDLLAAECRRKGVDVLLAPMVNLQRSPYGGRHFECLSEDPLLTARIGGALVRGLQRAGVAATPKALVANDSETDRFTVDARIDERTLRELYLAPFELMVQEARPWAVMVAYNTVNGVTMTESPLLEAVLREEWGFDGVVLSDWFAARDTVASGRAGLDLAMPGPTGPWGEALVRAVADGEVEAATVDAKLERVLRLAERVGAIDGVAGAGERPPGAWEAADAAAELRSAAAASFVLARNEGGLLPLTADAPPTVALLGPNAAVARTQGGGSATVFPAETVSPLAGLRAALGEGRVSYAEGARNGTRLAVAAPHLLDGTELRFLDSEGQVLTSERRFAASFVWTGEIADGVRVADVAAVELTTRLRPEATGEHVLGASGVGRCRIWVDGAVHVDAERALPPDADLGEWAMRPPQAGAPVALRAGGEVDVRLRFEPPGNAGAAFGSDELAFQLNLDPPRPSADKALAQAEALARAAEVAVVVVGTTAEEESEGFDRTTLELPGGQDELVRRVAAANPRTVVVVNAGAPVLLPWAEDVAAVLLTWFGGQELGHALADVLLGRDEPAGRLPTTWPASEDGLPSVVPREGVLAYDEGLMVGHRGGAAGARYPFGHGLGYAEWAYVELSIDSDGDGWTARVRVVNVGARPGREVVQLYGERPESAVNRPVRWLAGFAAVELGPGEEASVEIALPERRLAHWDIDAGAFVVEPGIFVLRAGRSSGDLRLSAELSR